MIIISGGQTGVDRAALDAAIELGIPHRGWCPKGRRAEDGILPSCYNLTECVDPGYKLRTELNVADSYATLLITATPELTPGTALTMQYITAQNKPYLWVLPDAPLQQVVDFIVQCRANPSNLDFFELNVAGSRESKAPGIYAVTKSLLLPVFARFS